MRIFQFLLLSFACACFEAYSADAGQLAKWEYMQIEVSQRCFETKVIAEAKVDTSLGTQFTTNNSDDSKEVGGAYMVSLAIRGACQKFAEKAGLPWNFDAKISTFSETDLLNLAGADRWELIQFTRTPLPKLGILDSWTSTFYLKRTLTK